MITIYEAERTIDQHAMDYSLLGNWNGRPGGNASSNDPDGSIDQI